MNEQDQKPAESQPEIRETTAPGRGGTRRRRAGIVLLTLCIVGALAGGWVWVKSKIEVGTDDAFITGHVFSVSPRIPGHVTEVLVKDNQYVKKGELLAVLDPANYQATAAKAEASLAMAKNETSGEYAQIDAAQAALSQATARLEQARLDLKRGKALLAREVIPREQFDRLNTAEKVAAGQQAQARENLRQARAVLGLAPDGNKEALVAQRQAELATAHLNLSYTRIYAPANGFITRKSVEVGNNVQPGQALMALVQLDDAWIVANYKESELTNIHSGDRVDFTVDAYPGRHFTGRVDSIMAGTGAAFSLLPPENATGNYVKVVQRVPVKILINRKSDPDGLLRVGMSVVPTVYTGLTFSDVLKELNPF
ncbi:MAG TPA: HlyD family secretion protein [Desulfuromonadales bacterium]|nr:HlyD family secretion protein [Desulfuromonadales bacterium]